MLGIFGTLSYAVFCIFVNLCICIFVNLCICVFVYLCIFVFVYLYLCICVSDSPEYHFWCPWTVGFSSLRFPVLFIQIQIQIHKYSLWWSAGNTQHVLYFEKPRVQGHQTWYSGLSNTHIHKYKCTNTQIQIHKNTNTQIQHMTKWQKYPTYAIFLNSWWFKDVKNDNPKYSDPRYTVDFCTVPPGLLNLVLN